MIYIDIDNKQCKFRIYEAKLLLHLPANVKSFKNEHKLKLLKNSGVVIVKDKCILPGDNYNSFKEKLENEYNYYVKTSMFRNKLRNQFINKIKKSKVKFEFVNILGVLLFTNDDYDVSVIFNNDVTFRVFDKRHNLVFKTKHPVVERYFFNLYTSDVSKFKAVIDNRNKYYYVSLYRWKEAREQKYKT